jgi:hypothetical protein
MLEEKRLEQKKNTNFIFYLLMKYIPTPHITPISHEFKIDEIGDALFVIDNEELVDVVEGAL